MDVALIVAGGSGQRMQSATPKQYLDINGKPIIVHTAEAFRRYAEDIKLIIVLPPRDSYWETIEFHFPDATLIEGGETRFHSVKNGLNEVSAGDTVAIHDGVRPLISTDTIHKAFQSAKAHGSGVVAVKAKDSIRKVSPSGNESINREDIYLVQTPQVFQADMLMEAFQQSYQDSFTDDASVVEAHGETIRLVEGDYKNIKITTQEDLVIAEALLR